MTIGPSRMSESVLKCMSAPPAAITDPGFLQTFGQCLRDLRIILGAAEGQSFITPGTGTMGLEIAAASFVAPGTPVAVVSTGYWGERWATICRRLGLEVHLIASGFSCVPDIEEIKKTLLARKCR